MANNELDDGQLVHPLHICGIIILHAGWGVALWWFELVWVGLVWVA